MGSAKFLLGVGLILLLAGGGESARTGVASKETSQALQTSFCLQKRFLEEVVKETFVENCNVSSKPSRFFHSEQGSQASSWTVSFSNYDKLDLPILQPSTASSCDSLYTMQEALETGAGDGQIAKPQSQSEESTAAQASASGTQFERWGTPRSGGRRRKGRDLSTTSSLGGEFPAFPNPSSWSYGCTAARFERGQTQQCGCISREQVFQPSGTVGAGVAWTSSGLEESLRSFAGRARDPDANTGVEDRQNSYSWPYQQTWQAPEAVDIFGHQNFRDGPQLEGVHRQGDDKVCKSSTNVSTMPSGVGSRISEEEPRDSDGQAGSATCFRGLVSGSACRTSSPSRTTGCGSDVRTCGSRGCLHECGGHGGSAGFRQCRTASRKIQATDWSIQPPQGHFAHQGPCRSLEKATPIDPWDLEPSWWSKFAFDAQGNWGDGCAARGEVPCQFDRWCTKSQLCTPGLPEEIDPEALRRLVEAGPVIASKKNVRFSSHVDVHYFAEGDCISGSHNGDASLVADNLQEVQGMSQHGNQSKHWRTDYVDDSEIGDGSLRSCTMVWDFSKFWEDCVGLMNQVEMLWEASTTCKHEGEAEENLALVPVRSSDEEGDDPLNDAEEWDEDIPASFSDWSLFIQGVSATPLENTGRIKLITFGLRNVDIGRRDVVANSLSPNHLRSVLWEAWQDQAERFEDLDIHYVVPQPWDELGEYGAIVLVVEVCTDSIDNAFRPILVHSIIEDGTEIEHIQATYVRWPVTRQSLIQRFRHWSYCQPYGFRDGTLSCAGDIVDVTAPGSDHIALARGSFCKFTIGMVPHSIGAAALVIEGFEKMAISVKAKTLSGEVGCRIKVLKAGSEPVVLPFSMADVDDSSSLLHSFSGKHKYLNHHDLFALSGCDSKVFHVLQRPSGCDAHCIVICKIWSCGQETIAGSQVVAWNVAPSLAEIFQLMVHQFDLPPSGSSTFYCDGDEIDSLDSTRDGDVVTHIFSIDDAAVRPGAVAVSRSRSRTPPGQLEEIADEHDGLSLLQRAVHRVVSERGVTFLDTHSHAIVVHDHGLVCLQDHDLLSQFQLLSRFALTQLDYFSVPQTWMQLCDFSFGTGSIPVWACYVAERPSNQSVVIAEVVVADAIGNILHHTIGTLLVPSTVDWASLDSAVQKLCERSSLSVAKLVVHGVSWTAGQQVVLDHEDVCQIWCFSDEVQVPNPVVPSLPIPNPAHYRKLISVLGLQNERVDLMVDHPDSDAAVNELAGGCGWTFFRHPQQVRYQRVAVVNWECVARDERDVRIALQGTLLEDCPVTWRPTLIAQDLCVPDVDWGPEGAVLKNGCFVEEWTTGIEVVPGDCILWIAPSASEGDSVSLGKAPCPCDRWCADPGFDTVYFGADCVAKFCSWMDRQVPVGSKSMVTSSSSAFDKALILTPRVQISLEASLTCGSQPAHQHGATVPIYKDFWAELHHNVELKLAPLPDGIKLHPATAKALSRCGSCQDICRSTIYIDGSADELVAGWAIVVVHEGSRGEIEFAGCLCGVVCTNDDLDTWMGAHHATNIDAELQAMIVAQITALTILQGRQVVIRPDLKFSHQLAALQVGARKDDVLAAVVAALGSLTTPMVAIQEVRGHTGDPWNELADRLAKFAPRLNPIYGTFPTHVTRQLAVSKLLREWLWWGNAYPHHKAAFPIECQDGEWGITPCKAHISDSLIEECPQDEQAFQLGCSIASINVCSAREKERTSSKTKGARATRLDQQLHAEKIAIAGLQETRMPQGQRTTQHYSVFASGCLQCGKSVHFGTEIWVSKVIAVASDKNGQPVYLGKERPTVLHADPRRLVLRFDGVIKLTIIAAHAPCLSEHNPIDEVEVWWQQFAQICQDIDVNGGVVCCIDANAPLASHGTSLYGMAGAERSNRQTRWFQAFLDSTRFAVPATLGCHVGDQYTWVHPKGAKLRRDYVLIHETWLPMVQRSRTIQGFDTGLFHVDHAPAVIDMGGLAVGKPRSRQLIDGALMHNEDCRQRFQDALHTLPMPIWSLNVDQHGDLVQTNVMQIARQVFRPRRKKQRERPQLQESTINFIYFKRQVLQMIRCACYDEVECLREQLRSIEKEVRRKVQHDQMLWYDDWVRSIQVSGEVHDHRQVFQKLIRLGRKKSGRPANRPLPMLKNAKGQMAKDFQEVQEIFCRQFAELEAGIKVSDEALYKLNTVPPPLSQDELDVNFVPSLWQLQRTLMRFKTGKAPGRSGLTVELFRAGGLPMLHHFLPLMVKSVLTVHEPLCWKGGRLFALYKGKGDPSDPNSFRSIFLSELAAKMLHAMVRTRLETCWEKQIQEIQHGGRKFHSTDTAHHIVQAHMAWARCQKTSSAVVFVDLKAAFYSVFRQSLIGGKWQSEDMAFLLSRLDVAAEDWADLIHTTENDNATRFLGEHARKMLQDMFTATYFEMTAVEEKVATSRGTRPGDPVGDILFNMLFRLVLQDVRRGLQHHPEAAWIGIPKDDTDIFHDAPLPATAYAEIAFVDDVAYIVHAPSPEQTVSLVQNILSAFKDAAAKRGLRVNFAEGKTEVLVNLVGPGSRAFKSRLWHTMNGCIPVVTENETCVVQAVHQYKHLGSFLQEKAIPTKDRGCRVSDARKAAGTLVRPFFAKPFLKRETKAPVFAALVSSRHLYNVHTWAWVSEDELHKWASGLKDVVRRLLGFTSDEVPWYHMATEDLYALAGLDAPMDALHAARLRYVKRAIRVAPPVLWQLLWQTRSANSWMAQLSQSFKWFRLHYPHTAKEFPSDLRGWLTMVAVDHGWKGRVKTALKACRQFRLRQAEGRKWTMSVLGHLRNLGGGDGDQPLAHSQGWLCGLCNQVFPTRRALAMHASQTHGYKPEAKYFVLGQDCLACGKRYFSRQRNLRHFQTSSKCAMALQACFAPASEETVEQADEEDRQVAALMMKSGWNPMKAFRPPLQMPMVALPPRRSQEAQSMQECRVARNGSGQKGFQIAEHWQVQHFEQGSRHDEASPDGDLWSYMANSDGGDRRGEGGVFEQKGPTVFSMASSITSRVFVHFFSGYRRVGDLQHQIERHEIREHLHVFCISIDICLAKEFSDLTEDKNLRWWKDRILSGQLLGIGGGPSCETWSAARLLSGGPDPVRDFGHPWGLPARSTKEHHQLMIGAKLVQFLLQLLVVAAARGLMGFLEHPAFPSWAAGQAPCSIWSIEVMLALGKLRCFQVATFDQCLWGCKARKPTTFLLLRMQSLFRRLRSRGNGGRCNHFYKHVVLKGRNYTGEFQTAIAKVYPVQLNTAICETVMQQAKGFGSESTVARTLPEILQPLMSNTFVESDLVQPDYAPQQGGS